MHVTGENHGKTSSFLSFDHKENMVTECGQEIAFVNLSVPFVCFYSDFFHRKILPCLVRYSLDGL